MNSKQLKDILGTVKNERRGGAPHDVWVKRNREILLMQVRNTTDVTSRPSVLQTANHLFSIFFPKEGFMMVARAAAVFVLMAGTVFGGGVVSAQVYGDALPGQFLYGVKIAVERAQLLLAPNDDYRTRLHTEFADNRIDELADLAEAPASAQSRVPEVLARFDAEVRQLQVGIEKMKSSDPDRVVETAKLMERKMAVYQNVLRKSAATLPVSVLPAIARSRDLVDGATISAIAVIVEKHLAGASDAPRTVVVNKFEERIRQAEAKIASTPATDSTKAKAAIAQVKELIKEERYQAALTKIAEVAELTKETEPEDTTEVPAGSVEVKEEVKAEGETETPTPEPAKE